MAHKILKDFNFKKIQTFSQIRKSFMFKKIKGDDLPYLMQISIAA